MAFNRNRRSFVDNNKVMSRIRKERADLSDYLWHFVHDNAPRETLKKILEEGVLKGGVYPPCQRPVVCFSEAPLSVCFKQSGMFKEEGYRYMSHYGIGFKKRWLFQKGALPVIYQPSGHYKSLPEELEWRHVTLQLSESEKGKDFDYTWQREWRVPLDKIQTESGSSDVQGLHFRVEDAIIVVPDSKEFENVLWEHDFDSELDDGVISYSYIGPVPLWSFIAADEVDITQLSNADIEVHRL